MNYLARLKAIKTRLITEVVSSGILAFVIVSVANSMTSPAAMDLTHLLSMA